MDRNELILLLILLIVIMYFIQYKENFMYVKHVYGIGGNCNDYTPMYYFSDCKQNGLTQVENFACGCANKNKKNMTYAWEAFDNMNTKPTNPAYIYPPNIIDANIISKSNPSPMCPNPICPMRVGCPCLPGCTCPKIQSSAQNFIENNLKNDVFIKTIAPSGFNDVQ